MTRVDTNNNSRPLRTWFFLYFLARIMVVAGALAALVLAAPTAQAQVEGRDRGFYLGINFIGSSLHVDDQANTAFFVRDDGSGLSLRAGYSFNEAFSLEFAFGGAKHDTSNPGVAAQFAAVQLFLHYRFSSGNAFRPFIKGGLGGYGLEFDNNVAKVRVGGGGIPVGGGFDYFFSRHFSLGVDFSHNIIQYNEVTFDLEDVVTGFEIDEEGAMSSLGLALTYYF